MTLIVVSLLLTAGVIAFVGYPLLKGSELRRGGAPGIDEELEELLARREALYLAIRDLDFDFETGKLSEEDYGEMRARYVAEAVSVLQELDQRMEVPLDDLEDELEAEIAARRKRSGQGETPSS